MSREELITHLYTSHGIARSTAENIIGAEDGPAGIWYMRGFHDGQHGIIDAAAFQTLEHSHG